LASPTRRAPSSLAAPSLASLRLVLPALTALPLAFPGTALAAEGAPHLNGGDLGLLWAVPFAGILLSIALMPLFAPNFWHHHFGKVSAFWAACIVVPLWASFGPGLTTYEILHTLLLEYIPFIVLLLALFTVAGGVRVKGALAGTPAVNTAILAVGTGIASLMGTTGACMLLIRPLIRANEGRRHKVHTVVFFIFLVGNIGGSLTPLGDPPLFLGFLKGVDFFWPTRHLLGPMLLCTAILLVVFFVLDSFLHRREAPAPRREPGGEALGIEGGVNILLLLAVIGAVLLSGVWKPGITFAVYHVEVALQNLVRDALLLVIVFLSLRLTSEASRRANAFTWGPILEVAKLFAGIFITIAPVIAILRAGEAGALGAVVDIVTADDGRPMPAMYFWASGLLSSFLDNAPTYLVFFNMASGDAATMMGELGPILLAISCGSVFMGANTYIGNAPNFMVKAIAEERGVAMPSFFGYMAWSGCILVPIFALVTLVFFL
jgi:Na+/H+ antiporter NhaD/arsenite permease-like protein